MNSATFALKWFKKLRKNTFKTLACQKLLTARRKIVSTLFGNKVKTNQKINLIEKYVFGNLGCKRLLKHLRNIFDEIVFIQETSRIQ